MTEFINYHTFSNLEEASNLIEILDKNQIQFEIDDSTLHFDVVPLSANPMENGVVIKIRAEDKERVDKIFQIDTEKDFIFDHYLFSFSDNDILDVIINPEEWTEEEIELAKKISKQRNLKPTAEQIKSLRKNTDKIKEQIRNENSLSGSTGFFLLISAYSISNSVLEIFSNKQYYLGGLGLNRVIMDIVSGVQQATGNDYFKLGIILTFILPIFFLWIWSKSKKKNRKAYLAGLIIFGIDTLLLLLYQSWICFAFQIFIIAPSIQGYITLITSKKDGELEDKKLKI